MKTFRNQHGMTLVELLVAVIITAIVSIFASNILLKGVENYSKISQETQFRDEADYLMSNLVKSIYTTRADDIQIIVNNYPNSYMETKTSESTQVRTGFIQNSISQKMEVFIKSQVFTVTNKNISINPSSKIVKELNGEISILLILEMNGKKMEFQNNIQPIPRQPNEERQEDK